LSLLLGCSPASEEAGEAASELATTRDAGFRSILSRHRVATLGAGLIRDGHLVWTGYYGEQAPGVPAGRETLFNVASITKTVTAELVVRLASDGVISLDEPMSAYWIDPDLVGDPRHEQLTPRLALTHRTGFPNWRYMDPEFRLRFVDDPGTGFGYSGEGMDYVARFLEKKTGQPFGALVAAHVFDPMGLDSISVTPQDWVVERLAQPVDEAGVRHEPYCSNAAGDYCLSEGEWSAADELATTVEAYARFMIGVMNGAGLDDALQAERFENATSHAGDPVLGCKLADAARCPREQGYGLGWEMFEFDDVTIVSHGGSDWSEQAMAYFDPVSRDGIVLFINGPASTSVEALIEGMRLLDPGSRIAEMYQGWMDAYQAAEVVEQED
jgi:CubicO group peptidase (beta-lactamase class C family)